MEGKEEKAPFEVDLKQLVEDLANYKNKVETLEKEKETVENDLNKYKTDFETLTTKYNEVEKKNGELYLQVAQSIVGKPNQEEQKQEEKTETMSLNDLCSELMRGI